MSGSFDWKTYVNNYEDLRKAGIDTEKKALIHWNQHGKKEGRICSINNTNNINNINNTNNEIMDDFDWKTYINNYEDLRRSNINTKEKARTHWVNYGMKEGRVYTKISDVYYFSLKCENINYDEYVNYLKLYTKNNFINNIIEKNIADYHFSYEPKKFYRTQDNSIINRNISENLGIAFFCNSIYRKKIVGFCIKTQKEFFVEKISFFQREYKNWPFIMYRFNCSGDEFVIGSIWEYSNPVFIYYPKTKNFYNISYRYRDLEDFVKNTNLCNICDNPKCAITTANKEIVYCLGFQANVGHYLWNEIMGFIFLMENNLIDNIDTFLIGENDHFNFGEIIIKNKLNKKIFYGKYCDSHNNNVSIGKHYINDYLIKSFNNLYGYRENIINNEYNIVIDIRTNSRIWLNQEVELIKLINELISDYKSHSCKFNIYFCGWYKTNCMQHTNDMTHVKLQNDIYENINTKINFSNNFNFINKINVNLNELIREMQKIDIVICNGGSGISFMLQVLFNKPIIFITSNNLFDGFVSQGCVLQSTNLLLIDKKYIMDYGTNFCLSYDSFYPFLKQNINKKLETLNSNICKN